MNPENKNITVKTGNIRPTYHFQIHKMSDISELKFTFIPIYQVGFSCYRVDFIGWIFVQPDSQALGRCSKHQGRVGERGLNRFNNFGEGSRK